MTNQIAEDLKKPNMWISGPSREDIRDSVGSKPNHRIKVFFYVIESKENFEGIINGLEWEDGSGESFNLKIFITEFPTLPTLENKTFKVHYTTKNRQGFLIL